MIAALPIATALLSVLSDGNDEVDYNEVFHRAVMLGNPAVFWDHIREQDVERTLAVLVPFLLEQYRTNKGHDGEFMAWRKVVDNDGTLAEEAVSFLLERLTEELASSKDVFDVKHKISEMKYDVNVGWLFYNHRKNAMLNWEDELFDFVPNAADYNPTKTFHVRVPVWGKPFIASSASMRRSRRVNRAPASGWPKYVISWDADNVLLAEDRTVTAIKNGTIETREEMRNLDNPLWFWSLS